MTTPDPTFTPRLEAAIALQHAGKNRGAAEAFMALFADFPTDARLADEAGNIYLYAMSEPAPAIACYERALPLVEDPTQVCFKLGFAHASSGDDDAASTWFARAHEHTPTHPDTFLEVAKLCMRRGAYTDALEYLETALAHHVMSTALTGGPSLHFQALVLMNQARIRLVHLDRVDEGLATVRTIIEKMEDSQRAEKLATELDAAGKPELARRVRALVEAHEG